MLLGYVLSIVRDFHLAEDVFQDASLIVLRKGEQLQDERDFPAWARKVVASFAENPDAGTIALDGRMIDRPHLTLARRILGLATAEPASAEM